MGKVLNTEPPSKPRDHACKIILAAIEILECKRGDKDARNDLIALIALLLKEIEKFHAITTTQWEKRGYWIKAEQYKSEWAWAENSYKALLINILPTGWETIPDEIFQIKQKLNNYTASKNLSFEFWQGAYDQFININKKSRA